MYLYINTTQRDLFIIALIDNKKVIKKKTVKSLAKHSEKLLLSIKSLLKSINKKNTDIKGIAVAKGPGSFTSLRVGITTANALGYAFDIPVKGIDNNQDISNIKFSRTFTKNITPKYE